MFAARILRLAVFLGFAACAAAHVGSPDVFTQAQAGPYSVLIAVRPPSVIPGVAQVEVQILSGDVQKIQVVPLPLVGPGKNNSPVPDQAVRDRSDARRFTASLWLMTFGSYQVRLDFDGAQGPARYSVPVPSISTQVNGMQRRTGAILFALMVFLVVGLVSITGAAVREARLDPGLEAPVASKRRAWAVMACALVFCVMVLWLGGRWWAGEDAHYRQNIYKPLRLTAQLDGRRLDLTLTDPGWLKLRKLDDLVPDHDHLMHLFLIRKTGLDRMAHLHPALAAPGRFAVELPAMDAGKYLAYADIVHENGLAETAVSELELPAIAGSAATGDDSLASVPPLLPGDDSRSVPLEAGVRMVWKSPAGEIRVNRADLFTFDVQNSDGHRIDDLQPYMGMAAHAEFIRADGKVFAHVHPAGSASMAAMMLAQPAMPMNGMNGEAMPGDVSFPYGVPSTGRYRVFIQVRRHGAVQTGAFDFTSR